jgi:hypothetical protein
MNRFWFIGASDDILDQPHACSKYAHEKNVQVFFFAVLHIALYRWANTAEPQLYVFTLLMLRNKGKYIIFTELPVLSGNKKLPNKIII